LAAEVFVDGLTAYAVLGAIFASAFLIRGVSRVDPHAEGAGLGFRLIIFPGVAAFWPFLLSRWIRVRS
jgi:hypothetical protein